MNPYLKQLKSLQAAAQTTEALADLWQWLYDNHIDLPTIEEMIKGRHWSWLTENGEFTNAQIREFDAYVQEYEQARVSLLVNEVNSFARL